MTLPAILLVVLLVAAAYNVVISILIYNALDRRGRHPSFLLLRMRIPVYAGDYRKLTRAETGHTGPLFYHWIVSINVAFVAGVVALLTLYLQA